MGSQRSFLAALMVSVVLGVFTEAFAQGGPRQPFLTPGPRGPLPFDEVVVQFATRVPPERVMAIHRAVGATVIRTVPVVGGTLYVVRVPDEETPAAIATRYNRFQEVASAEPNDAGYRPQPRK